MGEHTITLQGLHVSLEPLTLEHAADLNAAAADGQLWQLWFTSVPPPEQMLDYISKALLEQQQGYSLAFVVRHKMTNAIVGCTRFCHWDKVNRRIEIGYTWYSKSYQRSPVNSECKLLLLDYAFNQLDAIAVEFRTHWHNDISRKAITRLGAKQDAVLRHHKIDPNGVIRDTVVFSIIAPEWPAVEQNLRFRLHS
ncbi:GNAT family N-acetyltransferase [Shewanella aestuarii]|uniref:GNAT family N-acetyltransferase n=1 Tax=Shewanella aestuarii TaxID=1028752 RepID=A0A6G9QHY5_9GAMM|nr:GNAT family protein [Shewanella aestuarii]QIR14106.1 GNAT family N-acetyltransferase [Shewanella aestuarii]